MRLIDADELNIYTATHQELIMAIEEAQVVCNLEKIMIELESRSHSQNVKPSGLYPEERWIFLDDVIEIIKKGVCNGTR